MSYKYIPVVTEKVLFKQWLLLFLSIIITDEDGIIDFGIKSSKELKWDCNTGKGLQVTENIDDDAVLGLCVITTLVKRFRNKTKQQSSPLFSPNLPMSQS